MPIQTANLLAPLSQLHPFRMDPGGDNLEMERQRLELMRQQFEETKRQNLQDEEYKRLAQAAATRREQLINEREKQQQAAQAAAENLKQRQLALGEFNKQYYEGNLEGMSLAAAQLNQLGGYARRIDAGDGGFPAWQVDLEPPKTPAGLNPMDAIGYGTLGTGDRLEDTEAGSAPALSTEEAFRQAGGAPWEPPKEASALDPTTDTPDALTSENLQPGGAATDQYGPPMAPPEQVSPVPSPIQGLTPGMTHFAPRRAPDAEDLTGGVTNDVPTDVVNTAALQHQRQQRLGPVMASMAAAYPEAYRSHVEQAGNAMLEAGLPPEKTMQNAQAARQEVAGAVEKEQAHEFKMQEDAAKAAAEEKDPIKRQRRIHFGEARAESSYKQAGIKARAAMLDSAGEIRRMLTNDTPLDDEMVINKLMKLDEQVGSQTDEDARRVSGEGSAALTTTVKGWLNHMVNGGYLDEIKASMLEFADNIESRNRAAVHGWLEKQFRQADGSEDPLAGQGQRQWVEATVPESVLADYDSAAGDTKKPQGGALTKTSYEPGGDDGLDELAAQNGFDTGAIRRVVGGESKGRPQAASDKSSAKGLWQPLNETAQRFTNPRTGEKFANSAELAQLSKPEQYQVLMQYLKESKVTPDSPPEDYALAIAAPAFVGKSANEDAVVYKKGSLEWEKNKPWRPADDGDITVGSIIDYYFGNKKQGGAKPGKGVHDAEALEGL